MVDVVSEGKRQPSPEAEHPKGVGERSRLASDVAAELEVQGMENWSSYRDEDEDDDHARQGVDTTIRGDETVDIGPRHNNEGAKVSLAEKEQKPLDLAALDFNVFYTCGAGTGRSTVLRAIVGEFRRKEVKVEVVAPTGISALNVGGTTYLPLAGWHLSVMQQPIKEIKNMAHTKAPKQRIRGTKVLIIDEISTMEANQFRELG